MAKQSIETSLPMMFFNTQSIRDKIESPRAVVASEELHLGLDTQNYLRDCKPLTGLYVGQKSKNYVI